MTLLVERPLRADRSDLVVPDGFVRREFDAMGTSVAVLLPEREASAVAAVALLFERWEATFSRFDPSSELSRVNARAGRRAAVTPLMFDVVERALEAARATDGLFDPTLERTMRAIGYDRTFREVPADRPRTTGRRSAAAPDPALATGLWRHVDLDRAAGTIRLPQGAALDLGGIAKGLAVDAALAELDRLGTIPAAVEAGGDLAVIGLPRGYDAWPLRIELPDGGVDLAIRSGAVATSAVSRRAWRVDGERRHHLVDPRTGTSAATGLWSVSAFAASCGHAEVAAKTALLLGETAALPFLLRTSIPALLVRADGTQVLAGWPADRTPPIGASTPPTGAPAPAPREDA